VSTIEKLLERKSSESGLESREYGRAEYATLVYRQKLALTLPTSGSLSVGIVRSLTKATELLLLLLLLLVHLKFDAVFSYILVAVLNGPKISLGNVVPMKNTR
jgi:hypothetical protein